jgi:hypothetical protein
MPPSVQLTRYVPLEPAYPRERLAFLLADAGAPVPDSLPPFGRTREDQACLIGTFRSSGRFVGAGLDGGGERVRGVADGEGVVGRVGVDEEDDRLGQVVVVYKG